MTAVLVPLDSIRRLRRFQRNAARYPGPPAANDPPVDRAQTLEAGLRVFLAADAAHAPWADSVLIAQLAGATPAEREAIIAELAAWRPR